MFGNNEGGPPRVGQFFVAIEPGVFGNKDFLLRIEELFLEILKQDNTMLPGDERLAARIEAKKNGVRVDIEILKAVKSYKKETL